MKKSSARKHPQPQTTPRKKKTAAPVSWARSPDRASSLLSAAIANPSSIQTGGSTVEDLSAILSPSESREAFLTLDEEEPIIPEDEDEIDLRNGKSIFAQWSSIAPAQSDEAQAKPLLRKSSSSQDDASDDLMKALDRLACNIETKDEILPKSANVVLATADLNVFSQTSIGEKPKSHCALDDENLRSRVFEEQNENFLAHHSHEEASNLETVVLNEKEVLVITSLEAKVVTVEEDRLPANTGFSNPIETFGTGTAYAELSDADMFLAAACSIVEKNVIAERNLGRLPEQSASCSPSGELFARLKVVKVEHAVLDPFTGERFKRLGVICRRSQRGYAIELRGRWMDTPVCVNDTINIVWTEKLSFPGQSHLDEVNPNAKEVLFRVDDQQNFVIVRPDVLVCPTRVADANSCLRRAVLSERLAIETPSRDTILGHMKHNLFECCLRANRFDEEFIWMTIPSVVKSLRAVEDLFKIGMSEDDAIHELNKAVKTFAKWGETIVGPEAPGEFVEFGCGNPRRVRILKIVATEEMIWSPMWGLKGALDVTAVIGVLDPRDENAREIRLLAPIELKTGKAGPERAEHRAQIMLYSLLIADRYLRSPIPAPEAGVLVRAPTTVEDEFGGAEHMSLLTRGVRNVHHELRELIMIRNRIAVNTTISAAATGLGHNAVTRQVSNQKDAGEEEEDLDEREKLPSVTGNVSGECNRCFQRDACTLVHIAVENGEKQTMNLSEEDYEKAVGVLTPEQFAYYSKWHRILESEGRHTTTTQKQIWTKTAAEREAVRRCIGSLQLISVGTSDVSMTSEKTGHAATTAPNQNHPSSSSSTTILEFHRSSPPIPLGSDSHLMVGDLVLVSVEDSHHAVCRGHLIAVTSERILVRAQNIPLTLEGSAQLLCSSKWCIDRIEILWGHRFLQGSLASMFVQIRPKQIVSNNNQRSASASQLRRMNEFETHRKLLQQQNSQKERLRCLIIEMRQPRFWDPDEPGKRFIRDCPQKGLLQELLGVCDSTETVRRGLVLKRVPPMVAHPSKESIASRSSKLDLSTLTQDQALAACATLSAQDYLCIIGAPGSGKSTTIAFIVQMLHELGKSVLISSFTHAACDNLLLKIKNRGVDVLRIGLTNNVHKELRDSTLPEDCSVADLERYLNNPKLVCAATCLGVKHALLQRKMFDYCILDEAGQLAEPVALGPISRGRCIIFVGDPKQLPPLVVSQEAKTLGMERSLFERLVERHPTAVVSLTTQFRMNAAINALANELFYNGELHCGSSEVASRKLQVPFIQRCFRNDPYGEPASSLSWLYQCIDPDRPVIFLDTDGLANGVARESRRRKTVMNAAIRPMEDDDEIEEESFLVNQVEALLVHLIVDRFARSGLPLMNIGVISPYRSQLKILRSRLIDAVEVDTVDKFQGRDKDCIIVSLVRSNLNKTVGSLLSDWRRLNVAFTRAKCKLIVIGSGSTLSSPLCLEFLKSVRRRNWVVSLTGEDHIKYADPGLKKPSGS